MILALDTSMGGYGIALFKDDQLIAHQADPVTRELSEHLVVHVQGLMMQAGCTFKDLKVLVMATGPGTFTGIRVGFSLMKTLSLSLEIPLYGCSTLEVCAAMGGENIPSKMVVLDSKRAEPFVQTFGCKGSLFANPQTASLDAISAAISPGMHVMGNVALQGEAMMTTHIDRLDLGVVVKLALEKRLPAKPFYVRPADAKPSHV